MSFEPIDLQCPDCERIFTYSTELQAERARKTENRCPTCRFNRAMDVNMGFVRRKSVLK
jgi:DNA-directed RNA polymerase subunit RPC12/RpoP